MNHPLLYPKKEESFTQKHINFILFSLCVFVIIAVFLVVYAISEQSIFTSLGGV